MDVADDLDAVWDEPVENKIRANGQVAEIWSDIGSRPTGLGKACEKAASLQQAVDKLVGRRLVAFGDIDPDGDQILFGLRRQPEFTGHYSRALWLTAAAGLVLDGVR